MIRVYVTPNVRGPQWGQGHEDYFEVRVDERTVEGGINKKLLEILAEHIKIPKSRITFLKGARTRNKTIQVLLESTTD